MSSIRIAHVRWLVSLLILFAGLAAPVQGQSAAAAPRGTISVEAAVDVASDYVFRGVRQNSTGVATWPSATLAMTAFSSDGPLKRLLVGAGFWNSLHSGDTGSRGPAGKAWYESRLRGSLEFEFGSRVAVETSYTAYMSPSDLFTTVKEIGVKVAVHHSVDPYALIGLEIDAKPGQGQLDGGLHAGRYLELGANPGYSVRRLRVALPLRVGLSLRDYYELAGRDHAFGFASVGATVIVPLGGNSRVGRWNVHGGIALQTFGETTKRFNGGDRSKTIASIGVGLER